MTRTRSVTLGLSSRLAHASHLFPLSKSVVPDCDTLPPTSALITFADLLGGCSFSQASQSNPRTTGIPTVFPFRIEARGRREEERDGKRLAFGRIYASFASIYITLAFI